MKQNDRLANIGNQIIERGYPELQNVTILMQFVDLDREFGQCHFVNRVSYEIDITKRFKKVKKDVLVGCLAHELAHAVIFLNMHWLHLWLHCNLYRLIPWYRTWLERKTDRLALERGFGFELLALVCFHNKTNSCPYDISDCLTKKELKQLLYPNKCRVVAQAAKKKIRSKRRRRNT